MNKPRYIFVHHSAVSWKKNPKQFDATDSYHRSKGWGKAGYNYEISADGEIRLWRAEGSVTAAQYQKGMNDGRAISICLDGNFDVEEPTIEQCRAFVRLATDIQKRHNIHDSYLRTHRSIAPKTCPGKLIPENYISYFRKRVKDDPEPMPKHYADEQYNFFVDKDWWSAGKNLDEPPSRGELLILLKHMYDEFRKG